MFLGSRFACHTCVFLVVDHACLEEHSIKGEGGGTRVLHALPVRSVATLTRGDGALFPHKRTPMANHSVILCQGLVLKNKYLRVIYQPQHSLYKSGAVLVIGVINHSLLSLKLPHRDPATCFSRSSPATHGITPANCHRMAALQRQHRSDVVDFWHPGKPSVALVVGAMIPKNVTTPARGFTVPS